VTTSRVHSAALGVVGRIGWRLGQALRPILAFQLGDVAGLRSVGVEAVDWFRPSSGLIFFNFRNSFNSIQIFSELAKFIQISGNLIQMQTKCC
jgi:hypothetical protein